MKRVVLEFIHRGLTACGFGPIVLGILYLILQKQGLLETIAVNQVYVGIFSLSLLAFIAGGMNVIYQIEQLPLMLAIFIHGAVLYLIYLGTYLINDWLEWGTTPILFFSLIFLISYLMIWLFIYGINKHRTERLNKLLKHVEKEGD